MSKRFIYIICFSFCFIFCVLIIKLFNSSLFIRGFIGDVIFVMLIFFLAKVLYNFNSLFLAGITLAITYAAEFLQYFNLLNLLHLEHYRIARLILGSVFDPKDLIVYTIGAVVVYFIDFKIISKSSKKQGLKYKKSLDK